MESYPGLTAIPFWVLSLYCATRCSRGAIRDFSLRPAIRRDWAAFCASRFARFGDSADPDARRHARTCPYRRRPTLASTHAHSLITIRVLDHTRAHRRAHVRSRAHVLTRQRSQARTRGWFARARARTRTNLRARTHTIPMYRDARARTHLPPLLLTYICVRMHCTPTHAHARVCTHSARTNTPINTLTRQSSGPCRITLLPVPETSCRVTGMGAVEGAGRGPSALGTGHPEIKEDSTLHPMVRQGG